MEKRLNKSVETYISAFKNSIRDKIIAADFQDKTNA
jgi:hypothetical protein